MANTVIEDFASAASRHLRDAKLLLLEGRFDNAGYLVGYVAECGVKALIAMAGRPPKIHDLQNLADTSLRGSSPLNRGLCYLKQGKGFQGLLRVFWF